MKFLNTMILYILFLVAMILCSTAVMKVLDLILDIGYEKIWNIGYKVGFIAWLLLSGAILISKKGKSKSE